MIQFDLDVPNTSWNILFYIYPEENDHGELEKILAHYNCTKQDIKHIKKTLSKKNTGLTFTNVPKNVFLVFISKQTS